MPGDISYHIYPYEFDEDSTLLQRAEQIAANRNGGGLRHHGATPPLNQHYCPTQLCWSLEGTIILGTTSSRGEVNTASATEPR